MAKTYALEWLHKAGWGVFLNSNPSRKDLAFAIAFFEYEGHAQKWAEENFKPGFFEVAYIQVEMQNIE